MPEHRNKTLGWIPCRYFSADDKGRFSVRVHDREGKQRVLKVHRLAHTVIERHIKARGEANPYDPNYTRYFENARVSPGERIRSAMTECEPAVVVKELIPAALVDRDRSTRWASGLAVQFDAGKLSHRS